MSYFIFFTITLVLAVALHLKHQQRQTARIRQNLHEARSNKVLTGLHSLRERKT